MRRILLITMAYFTMSAYSFAQIQIGKDIYPKFSADTVKQSIDDITKELSLKQPGFYRYTSRNEFNKYIDSVKSTITDSLTEQESYLKLKPLITKIHCLHTGLSLPKDYQKYLDEQPNLIPLQLYFMDHKAWVTKNYSNDQLISPGDEILTINDRPIGSIIDQLLPLIPSDGYNLTMKYRALYLQFPTWFRILRIDNTYTVVLNHHGVDRTAHINGVKYNELARDGFLKEPILSKQLEFKIENNIGILTIHSFARSNIIKAKQNFKSFIDKAFLDLKSNHIQTLIVDLRDNTGGSDPNAVYFTSFFFDKPFRFWDRIEVTSAIAKQIKGITLKALYRVPVQKDSIWLWQKAKHTDEFDFYTEQNPAKNNYSGKTYILINGFCMSSCADVAAVLSYNKKALFFGEETGGAYEGNNSGMIPEWKITPYNFMLSVPLQEFFNYVDFTKNNGKGTIPDYPVYPKIEDMLTGQDELMAYALYIIKAQL
jgi:hypothetical protein